MRIILFSILMLFLGQLSFNCAVSFVEDEDEIALNSEETEDGEGEEKIEYEKESTKTLTGHGSIELYRLSYFFQNKTSNADYNISAYPAVYVTSPYCPPDRNC